MYDKIHYKKNLKIIKITILFHAIYNKLNILWGLEYVYMNFNLDKY